MNLPPSVHGHLPEPAQDICRTAFNHAFASHAADAEHEEITHSIASAAVKHSYFMDGDPRVLSDRHIPHTEY